ncbi:MAG: phosphoribosylglycinamide formyltransferase [Nitrosomonas sp.]|nr:phosphoribosylglycinamide formyltransferase [Nitrosomonas sp.]MBK7365678.1 phosphoribosylglycinamide formyltransferase [Nitrosomonas sp.]
MQSLVILISGRGSNLQALITANLPVKSIVVISNNPSASGLAIAQSYQIATHVIDHRCYLDRDAFDAALAKQIDRYQPDLIALAGFMRILGDNFINRYRDRLINIHPSLLPSFPGLNTHVRALERGVKIHGCTVHFVTNQLDHGPIVIQAAVPVFSDDTPDMLANRVLKQEHLVYPKAVRWFLEGRIKLKDDQVKLAPTLNLNQALHSPAID